MTDNESISYSALKQRNSARILEALISGNPIVDAWPSFVAFEFTGACNLHCFMCGYEMFRDKLRGEGRTKFTLPVEMFRLVIEKTFPYLEVINPTLSGEPFVLPYFDELIDAAERYGCKIQIITNGMLMTGDRLRRLMPRLLDLSVSMDGATKKTFDYVRTGADFDVVVNNLDEFVTVRRELGLQDTVPLRFNVTLLAENVHELPQIVELAAAHEVESVRASYMIVLTESVRSSSPLNCPEKTNRALADAVERAAELGVAIDLPKPLPEDAADFIECEGTAELAPTEPMTTVETGAPTARSDAPAPAARPEVVAAPLPEGPAARPEGRAARPEGRAAEPDLTDAYSDRLGKPPDGWDGKFYCDMPWRRLYLGLNGEVFPCCAPGRPIMGNAFQQDFMEIWNGPEYRRLREGLHGGNLTDYCQRCPFLRETGMLEYEAEGHVHSQDA